MTGPLVISVGLNLADYWQLEDHKLGELSFYPFSRRHSAQEPDAGKRFRAERDVPAWGHLLRLP